MISRIIPIESITLNIKTEYTFPRITKLFITLSFVLWQEMSVALSESSGIRFHITLALEKRGF